MDASNLRACRIAYVFRIANLTILWYYYYGMIKHFSHFIRYINERGESMNDSFLKTVLRDICADITPDEVRAKMLLQLILEQLKPPKKE